MRLSRTMALGLLVFGVSTAAAEPPPDNHALRLRTPQRFYPPDINLNTRFGGRAEVDYCVDGDGFVVELRLTDSSGNGELDRSAKRVVKRWRYQPLILGGQPVRVCGVSAQVAIEPSPAPRPRDTFRQRSDRVDQLIREGRLSEARSELDALAPIAMSEVVICDRLRLSLAEAEGDAPGQLAALLRLGTHGERLEAETRTLVRQRLFGLQVLLGKMGDAFASYELLEAQEVASLNASMQRAASELIAAAEGAQPIATRLELAERTRDAVGPAFAATGLLRRAFSFDAIAGAVDLFRLSCGPERDHVDRVSLGKEWRVPAAWKGCTITVYGAQGSSLRLIELPSEPAVAPSPPAP